MNHQRWIIGCLAAILSAQACFGPPTATYRDNVVEKGPARFRLGPVPAGWEETSVGDEDVAFLHKATSATLTVQVSCGRQYDDAPLRALSRHLWMGMTDVQPAERKTITLAGREAIDARVEAKLDGVPLKMRAIILKKDGCVYDFVLTQPRPDGAWEGLSGDLDTLVSGFESPVAP